MIPDNIKIGKNVFIGPQAILGADEPNSFIIIFSLEI